MIKLIFFNYLQLHLTEHKKFAGYLYQKKH